MSRDGKPAGPDDEVTPVDFEAQRPPLDRPPDRRPLRPLPAVVAAVHVPLPRASPTLKGAPYVGGDGEPEEPSSITRPRTGRTRQMYVYGAIIVGVAQMIGLIGKCSAPLVDAVADRIRQTPAAPEGKK